MTKGVKGSLYVIDGNRWCSMVIGNKTYTSSNGVRW